VSTTLARRLGKLEVSALAKLEQKAAEAIRQLCASVTREHAFRLRTWLLANNVAELWCGLGHPRGRFCVRCIESADPPAVVRAFWVPVFRYVEVGAPAVFPASIAQVYVDHPDAVPGQPCPACGYLLPTRRGRLAYTGDCPECAVRREGQQ
jgi:hypothetical protein